MRRLVAAALAAALLLSLPLGADAGRKAHPHVVVLPGDSITVSDTTFGGSAAISYTLASTLGPTENLQAFGTCQAVDGGWGQFVVLADGAGTFTNIGPTPTWSAGGATCSGSLVAFDWYAGTLTVLASDDFLVGP
jgi:hypothetical protein